MDHLQHLEDEAIEIIREAVAQSSCPVMLYSIGKDSSTLLHLALKAFFPARPPFPLLHVDTGWKFREMIAFRDRRVRETGMDLIVHINPRGQKEGIGPFTHGSSVHTDVMTATFDTLGGTLRRVALNKYQSDTDPKQPMLVLDETGHRYEAQTGYISAGATPLPAAALPDTVLEDVTKG